MEPWVKNGIVEEVPEATEEEGSSLLLFLIIYSERLGSQSLGDVLGIYFRL